MGNLHRRYFKVQDLNLNMKRGYMKAEIHVPTVILLYSRFLLPFVRWRDMRLSVAFKTVAARGLVNGRGPRSGRDSVPESVMPGTSPPLHAPNSAITPSSMTRYAFSMHSTVFICEPSSFLTSAGRIPASVPILYMTVFIIYRINSTDFSISGCM